MNRANVSFCLDPRHHMDMLKKAVETSGHRMRVFIAFIFLALSVLPSMAQIVPAASPQEATGASQADINALVRILENDETRAQLIQRLQQGVDDVAPQVEDVPSFNVVQQLSSFTDSVALGLVQLQQAGSALWAEVQRGSVRDADLSGLAQTALHVALVFAAVYGGFFVLRLIVNWSEGAISRRVAGRGWLWRLTGLIVAIALEAGSILLATAFGYVAAQMLLGIEGDVEFTMSLLITAFMFVEFYKLAMRVLLAPRHAVLRLLPVSDEEAAYWSFWFNRLASLMGYSLLFVVPALAFHFSPGLGRLVEILAMTTALVLGIIIVIQNREDVRLRLHQLAEKRQHSGVARALEPIGLQWHVLAIAYLVALYLVWLANPRDALGFMVTATIQSAIAVLVGVLIFAFISRFAGLGPELPNDLRERLPLLETRLQAFVPRVLAVVRWLVVLGVVLAIAQAWLIFDVVGWIATDAGARVVGSAIAAGVIILACVLLYIGVSSWVEFRLSSTNGRVPTAREKTLLSLFKNAFTVGLVIFGLMFALAQIGVNIAPLLAGAGVVGLAIGFGAQKLVQDIITGIFIQFENVMNEGDVVALGSKSGVVEKLTIRSVTIRDLGGTVHLIPFSSVDEVSNMMRGFSFHVGEYGVAYESDIDQVKDALREAFSRLLDTEHKSEIIDDLDVQGVISFADSAIIVRVRIKTLPGKHWGTGRAYNELVKAVFDERGIEIPYPHVTYVPAVSSGGSTQAPSGDGNAAPAGLGN